MSLRKYLSKRTLRESLEPLPKLFKRKKGDLQFVVQKHAATRLHYDLRLEVDGVLKSWAVPKGISLDPNVKRLAIQVEDHPYDYKDFEGIIPKGYGAGTVIIWDHGSYTVKEHSPKESEQLAKEGLKKGEIHFTLQGEKLRGEFVLVKLKNKEKEWLLFKKKDAFATQKDINLEDRSVVTDKKIEDYGTIKKSPSFLKKIVKTKKPKHLCPMLATLIDQPFDDPEWIFEIKWDGFRSLAVLDGNNVELYSRNLISFNSRFPLIADHLKQLNLDAVFDGEIVILDEKGISHFQFLQNNQSENNVYYYVFDLLYFQGKDLRKTPLIERKSLLKNILKKTKSSHIRYADHIEQYGVEFLKQCDKKGCEGIIGKKKQSTYLEGERSKNWVKIKTEKRQEMVICGFTEPKRGENISVLC